MKRNSSVLHICIGAIWRTMGAALRAHFLDSSAYKTTNIPSYKCNNKCFHPPKQAKNKCYGVVHDVACATIAIRHFVYQQPTPMARLPCMTGSCAADM